MILAIAISIILVALLGAAIGLYESNLYP